MEASGGDPRRANSIKYWPIACPGVFRPHNIHSCIQAGPKLTPLRHRFLWRLRAPSDPSEIRRVEGWLATARLFLAIGALIAIRLDPKEMHFSPWAYGLFAFYMGQGVLVLMLLRQRRQSTPAFRLLVHTGDVAWPVLISVFATGRGNPFVLFFVFVLAAAAYRWGLWETLTTAIASVALLWLVALAFSLGIFTYLDHILARLHMPVLRVDAADFAPEVLLTRSIYLIVMGMLLGYLAEQQKQLRAEKAVIARVLGGVSVEAGLGGTLQAILAQLLEMYDSPLGYIASQEGNSQRVFVGEVRRTKNGVTDLRWMEPAAADRDLYLGQAEAELFLARRNGGAEFTVAGFDKVGGKVRNGNPQFLSRFFAQHEFESLVVVPFVFGKEWWGRVFLLNPRSMGKVDDELRFLQELVRQVGPAVYNVYLLRRLRMRAGAVERARFARELHDGAVQSLIAVEMQVDVLKRQARGGGDLHDELGRIQGLLREEVLKLRELMQQMKSLDVDSRRLLGLLTDTVERFQRETGISARFMPDVEELEMPQAVCREVARIVQESLVNVRKHSRARHVIVRLSATDGEWNLTIEDDGCGFPFEGSLSHSELDAQGRGPTVIKERVRVIEGELTIESAPGHGSRLKIAIPQKRAVAYG